MKVWIWNRKLSVLKSEEYELLFKKFIELCGKIDRLELRVVKNEDELLDFRGKLNKRIKQLRNEPEDIEPSKALNSPFSPFVQ